MITRLRIKNYRSFGALKNNRDHDISLAPFTVIVGDNSSGKSNIIRAIEFATTPDVVGVTRWDFFVAKGKREKKAKRIQIDVTSTNEGAESTLRCTCTGNEKDGYTKSFKIDGKNQGHVDTWKPVSDRLRARLRPFQVSVAPTAREVGYLATATDLVPTETRSAIAGSRKKLVAALRDSFKKVCSALVKPLDVRGVDVTPTVDLADLFRVLRVQYNVADAVRLPVENLGQGDLSKAILKLAELKGGQRTICVEEPEIHVHPTGVKYLVQTFRKLTRSGKRQVLITTHSPEVVNNTAFSELLIVRKRGQRSCVLPVPKSILVGCSRKDGSLEDVILRKRQRGEVFLSKYVLLTEGEFDRLVLDAIDRDGRIALLDNEVTVIDMGSKEEFPKYFRLLRELERPFVALLDSDAWAARDQNNKCVIGPVLNVLLSHKLLVAADLDVSKFCDASPKTRRAMVSRLQRKTVAQGFATITHGHPDMSEAVDTAWQHTSDQKQREDTFRFLGGRAPNPAPADVDRLVRDVISRKKFGMVAAASSIPVSKFEFLSRQITRAVSAVKKGSV
jgi:predicted ATPase